MKRIRKRIVTAVIGFVLLFSSGFPIYGVEISQFSFDISAQLDGNYLNVVVDAKAPAPAGTGTFYCYFKSEDVEIKDPIGASTLGVDDIVDGSIFSYGDTIMMVWKSDHEGSTSSYSLKFDVSGTSISEGSTLEMLGAGSKLGMQEGTCIAWDSDILVKTGILASCTIIEKSEGSSTSTTVPNASITDTTNGATVTGTVDNGIATLNVACDKACVVAYTKDNGATYNRLTANPNSEGNYDFIVPETYTDTMKFVIAVKGDANGDGETDAGDAAVASAFEVGNITLNSLQQLIADINLDGSVDSGDSAAAKAVDVGNLTLNW